MEHLGSTNCSQTAVCGALSVSLRWGKVWRCKSLLENSKLRPQWFAELLGDSAVSDYLYLTPSWLYLGFSVQFSCSVVSNSLRPHGLQHTRLPCPSATPGVYSNSCPLSWWYHPTISSSVVPFSCLQSFPASGSFQMSQLFASGGQGIGVSASTSVLPMNIQDWFPLGWTGWTSLQSKGLSRVFSTVFFFFLSFFFFLYSFEPHFKSINSSALSFLYSPSLTSIHDYWKNHSLD